MMESAFAMSQQFQALEEKRPLANMVPEEEALNEKPESAYYKHQAPYAKLVELFSTHVRKQMFRSLMSASNPTVRTNVLDVGVTSNTRSDSNFFEAAYTFPEKITAVGLEDASFLEREYPGLKYITADALNLPFKDKSFDLAVSWAVIEHIGSRDRQRAFVSELSRVSKAFFITTPNRWYPVEFHTVLPLLHWLPACQFRAALKLMRMPFYATEETLNLLDEKSCLALLPPNVQHKCLHSRLFGPISNLGIYAWDSDLES